MVNAGTPQTIGPIELGAADARVTVRSVPSGAQVTTGGSFRGVTPVTIELVAGRFARHHRRARRLRAVDARSVRRSRRRNRTLDARLAALLVEVRIQGEPADAEVFVNGNSRGKAPASLSAAGEPPSHRSAQGRLQRRSSPTWCWRRASRARVEFKLVNPKDVAGNSPQTHHHQVRHQTTHRRRRHVPGGHRSPRAGPAPERRRAQGDAAASVLHGRARGHQRAVPPVPRRRTTPAPSASTRSISTSSPWRASPGKTPRNSATGCRRRKACRPRIEPRRRRRLRAHRAGDQRLPAAHRGRVGVRGARREHRQAAQVSLGRGSARGVRHRQLRRQRGARVVRRGPSRATRTNSPRWPRRRCSRRIRSASTTSPATCRSGSTTATFPSSPPRAVTDPLGPNDGKGHTYRGSNWRTVATGELRFPWREGAVEASDVIGFRVARYVAPE